MVNSFTSVCDSLISYILSSQVRHFNFSNTATVWYHLDASTKFHLFIKSCGFCLSNTHSLQNIISIPQTLKLPLLSWQNVSKPAACCIHRPVSNSWLGPGGTIRSDGLVYLLSFRSRNWVRSHHLLRHRSHSVPDSGSHLACTSVSSTSLMTMHSLFLLFPRWPWTIGISSFCACNCLSAILSIAISSFILSHFYSLSFFIFPFSQTCPRAIFSLPYCLHLITTPNSLFVLSHAYLPCLSSSHLFFLLLYLTPSAQFCFSFSVSRQTCMSEKVKCISWTSFLFYFIYTCGGVVNECVNE